MKDTHIINLLESMPFKELNESDLAEIRAHAAACEGCHRAFEAAQITAVLLEERAAESLAPSPFFQTRVMAAVREQQKTASEGWSLLRLWRSAGALASTMAATVVLLGVLTVAIPSNTTTSEVAPAYSPETLIMNQGELSDDQIMATLYGPDEDAVK